MTSQTMYNMTMFGKHHILFNFSHGKNLPSWILTKNVRKGGPDPKYPPSDFNQHMLEKLCKVLFIIERCIPLALVLYFTKKL